MINGVSPLFSNNASLGVAKPVEKNANVQIKTEPPEFSYGVNIDAETGAIKIHKAIPGALDSDSWYTINPDGSGISGNCWNPPQEYPSGTFTQLFDETSKYLSQLNQNKQKYTSEEIQTIIDSFNAAVENKTQTEKTVAETEQNAGQVQQVQAQQMPQVLENVKTPQQTPMFNPISMPQQYWQLQAMQQYQMPQMFPQFQQPYCTCGFYW